MSDKMNTGLLCFYILISSTSFIFALTTMWQFVVFLSGTHNYSSNSNERSILESIQLLVFDFLLLIIFILIHSGLAARNVKGLLSKFNLDVIQRSVYVAITCLGLQLIMFWWQHLTNLQLWSINTENSVLWRWAFTFVHVFAWLCIYGGCILYDFAELMGIKQVYYYCQGFDAPIHYKSLELQQMYNHMRHPSFIAFCCIFWFYPIMTLDRFILAIILTMYMSFQFKVDRNDYIYQQQQFGRKYYEETVVTTHYRRH